MEHEFDGKLEDEEARASDSTDYNDLLRRFTPNEAYGSYLADQAEFISHYLKYRSPENRAAGLMAHQSAILAGINRGLSRILFALVINTALVGYIVYTMI